MNLIGNIDLKIGGPLSQVVNAVSEHIGQWSQRKGFWKAEEDAEWLCGLADTTTDGRPNFNGETRMRLRAIAEQHRILHRGMKIALAHSELSEMLEALRDGGADGLADTNYDEELVDTIIRLLDQAAMSNTNPGDSLVKKLLVNEDRPFLHGRKA